MDTLPNSLDWSLLRSVLAVAQTGSLSAAARVLNLSQPTIGRHIQTAEEQLRIALFDRHAKGLALTDAGADLMPYLQAMEQASHQLALAASGQQEALTGTVRLTASEFVAHYVLPPILAELRVKGPGIQIELVASDQTDNLLFREADIAVRMFRPNQLDLTTLHLGNVSFGVFAATSYLDRRGTPQTPEDLLHHDLIGLDRDETILRAMQEGGLPVTRDHFTTRTDHPTAYWQLLRAGCGIGFSQTGIAQADASVKQVLEDLPIAQLELWLTAPIKTRHTPRLSKVWDHLKSGLKHYLAQTGT